MPRAGRVHRRAAPRRPAGHHRAGHGVPDRARRPGHQPRAGLPAPGCSRCAPTRTTCRATSMPSSTGSTPTRAAPRSSAAPAAAPRLSPLPASADGRAATDGDDGGPQVRASAAGDRGAAPPRPRRADAVRARAPARPARAAAPRPADPAVAPAPAPARRGAADPRRTLRAALRNDGELRVLGPPRPVAAAAQGRAADRRVRLDVALRGRAAALRARHGAARAGVDRGVHARHPAHPGHPGAAAARPGARAGGGRPGDPGLVRRHPARRGAALLRGPLGAARRGPAGGRRDLLRRLGARRHRRCSPPSSPGCAGWRTG